MSEIDLDAVRASAHRAVLGDEDNDTLAGSSDLDAVRSSVHRAVLGPEGGTLAGSSVPRLGIAASGVRRTELEIPANPAKATPAAITMQAVFRGVFVRRRIYSHLDRAVAVPDLARAEAHAKALLPSDQEGELLPLSCPIECFRVFGSGIFTYMLWSRLMRNTFIVCFMLSVATMVHNLTGGKLQDANLLVALTLGNVDRLNSSYGATQALVLGVLLYAMFQSRHLVRMQSDLLRPYSTPADHTVALHGLHPAVNSASYLSELASEFGEVTHAIVAPPIRDLMQRMETRRTLLETLQSRQIELFLTNARRHERDAIAARGGKSTASGALAKRRTSLLAAVEGARQKLQAHDAHSKAEAYRLKLNGAGIAFITFENPADAAAAISAINDPARQAALRAGIALSTGSRLRATRAPEPTDVIWENLQVMS